LGHEVFWRKKRRKRTTAKKGESEQFVAQKRAREKSWAEHPLIGRTGDVNQKADLLIQRVEDKERYRQRKH